jgi:HEAT repeat protein
MMRSKTPGEYLDDLDNEDIQIKLKALDKLGKAGSVSAGTVSHIISLLNNDNWKIRAGAARSLGYMGRQAEAAIPCLINALNDKKPSVRSAAAVALGRMGEKAGPAVQMLTKTLRGPYHSVRIAASIALGSIGPSAVSALGDLLKLLSLADNFSQRYAAWESIKAILSNDFSKENISKYVKPEDIPQGNPFVGKLQGRVTPIRPPKIKTIERYLLELQDNDQKKRIAAMKKLSAVVCLRQEHLNAVVIPGIPHIKALLSDPSWKTRSWAARLLGRIGPEADESIPGLINALKDDNSTVRECAAYALGLLGEKANAAIPMLEKALQDPYTYVRSHAHMSLRRLQHPGEFSDPKSTDEEMVYYHIDDDELDIHYGVLGYRSQTPDSLIAKKHSPLNSSAAGETRTMRLKPGDQVRITQNAWENDGPWDTLVATRGSIGTVLSYDEFIGYVDNGSASSLEERPTPIKNLIDEGSAYPIRFETVVPPSDDAQDYHSFACEVGTIEVLNTTFFEKIP